MGRQRKKHRHLPPRMQFSDGAYYWTPYQQCEDGKKRVRWYKLSRSYPAALEKWGELEGQRIRSGSTVGEALDRYLTDYVPTLGEKTQRDYRAYSGRLRRVFGHTPLSAVKPSHIAQYLDSHHAKTLADREVAMLSGVFKQAMRWGWCETNPCRGVQRNNVKNEQPTATEESIAKLLLAATEREWCILALRLLVGLRKPDLLPIRLDQFTDEGLVVTPTKTSGSAGTTILYEWTPDLEEVYERGKALKRPEGCPYLVPTKRGSCYTVYGWDTVYQALRKRAGVDLPFNSLRARAITDADDQGGIEQARWLAGHSNVQTTALYLRRVKPVRAQPVKRNFRETG